MGKKNLITHFWRITFCYWAILEYMSEISNTRDRMGDKSNVLNTKSCPLIHYGCQEDQEVSRKKDSDQRCPWRRCRCRHRCRAATAVAVVGRLRQVLEKVIAAAFFSRTLKNCMNLVEFQCLQMKHPETEWIWWSSTNISGPIQSRQWNLEHFFENHRGSGAVRFFISHRVAAAAR